MEEATFEDSVELLTQNLELPGIPTTKRTDSASLSGLFLALLTDPVGHAVSGRPGKGRAVAASVEEGRAMRLSVERNP